MTRFLLLALAVACAPLAGAHTSVEIQIDIVTREIAQHPDDYTLYLRRGDLRRHIRDWPGAEADFTVAEKLGTDEVRVQIQLYRGRLLQEAGQARKAVRELDSYLAANPNQIDGLRLRALAYAQMGAVDSAIADYSRLIDLDPDRSPELWLERARLWMQIERDDVAISSIDEAIGIFGPLVTLVVFNIDTEVGLRNYIAALDRIDELPSSLAETPEWLLRRGELLSALDRPGDAAGMYARAQQAISSMPPRRQKTAATRDLVARLRSRVAVFDLPE